MTAFPSYSTGTVAIAANGTTVTGTGSNWSGQNAMSGDLLVVGGQTVIIQDVTNATTLAIDAWPFAAVTVGSSYKIYKVSPLRFVGALSAQAVDDMVTALNTNGFYVFVGPNDTVPDPSLGQSNQYALQATTGKIWQKVGGVWTFIATYKGFGLPAPWSNSTAYLPFDVVTLDGTSYVCIQANTNETPSSGDSPPNAFWTVLAEKGEAGDKGDQGDPGVDAPTYGGTSTTSLAIGTGSKAFTTQAGLAYQNGARVRASSAADTTKWQEGVATYSGTTLTITADKTNGSGTHADWNLNVVGEPGAGDLSSGNNLSDVADAAAALANLGGVGVSGAPTANQVAVFSDASTVEGVGPGAVGQQLVSKGSGSPPSFQSGGWVLLNTLTANNTASTLSDTTSITSDYSEIEIVLENVLPATNNINIQFRLYVGGILQNTLYLTTTLNGTSSTTSSENSTGAIVLNRLSSVSNGGAGLSGRYLLSNPGNTSSQKWIHGQSAYTNGAPSAQVTVVTGYHNSTGAITGIQLLTSTGNIVSGIMKIYGRN